MELRHLRYFVTVAEELNFSRASARLRVSQPAVSRQVKTLEEEVGGPLFERVPGALRLTRAGTVLLGHARELLRRSAQALLDVKSMAESGGNLHLGYLAPAQADFLTAALRAFQRLRSGIRVHLYELTPAAQVTALRAGKLDLALIGHACPAALSDLVLTRLRPLRLRAVLPDHHLLALRKTIAIRELAEETFIGFTEEAYPGRNQVIAAACQASGFTPQLRPCAESLSAALGLIGAGEGVGLMPEEVAAIAHPGAVFIPLRRPVPRIQPVAATREASSTAARDLLACIVSANAGTSRGDGARRV